MMRQTVSKTTNENQTIAECFFVDVGQGTCSIILLGQRRAIVIDAGPPKARAPVGILKRFGVDVIAALIISHNDLDHCGGAEAILSAYPHAIEKILFLDDRSPRKNVFFARVQQEMKLGNLLRPPERLEGAKYIHCDSESGLRLRVLFPSFMDNMEAQAEKQPNRTSAVLALECGTRRIVFPGDLEYAQWRKLSNGGANPVRCDILAVPHHGGRIAAGEKQQEWIYKQAIQSSIAIVSVGSANQHGHPRSDHIGALVASGATVICTQITERCSDQLEQLRPGVVRPRLPGESSPETQLTSSAKRSKNVACAGTVLVEFGPGEPIVHDLAGHQAAVEKLKCTHNGHPLCRCPT